MTELTVIVPCPSCGEEVHLNKRLPMSGDISDCTHFEDLSLDGKAQCNGNVGECLHCKETFNMVLVDVKFEYYKYKKG